MLPFFLNAIPYICALAAGVCIAVAISRINIQPKQLQHNQVPSEYRRCGVCMEYIHENNEYRLRCGHKFHRDCIQTVFHREVRRLCPVCRESV